MVHDKRREYLNEMVGYDYILDEFDAGEFSEFTISIGGDVIQYRVYGQTDFQCYVH